MKLSIIIPAHNEEKYIGYCLENILAVTRKSFLEIIVVNNASTDKTKEVALSYPGVKVVDEFQKGPAHARQRGLLEAKGDVVAYIDADSILSDDWFAVFNREFSEQSDLVCLSGPCHYPDIPKLHSVCVNAYWHIAARVAYKASGYLMVIGNFVAKKEALLKIGGFDPAVPFYGDDTNIARRLNKIGKVKFLYEFFIYTSPRRFIAQGFVKTGVIYGTNYLSEALLHKPLVKRYKDIR